MLKKIEVWKIIKLHGVLKSNKSLKKKSKKASLLHTSTPLLFLSLNIKEQVSLMIKTVVIDLGSSVNI